MLLNQIINLKLFKFGLTGIFNTFFFYLFYVIIVLIGNNYKISFTLSWIFVNFFSFFIITKIFSKKFSILNYIKFFLFEIIFFFFNFFFLIFLIETLSINNFIAPLINIFVFFFLRFFLYNNFFFK